MTTCRTCRHNIGDFCRVAFALGDPAATLIHIKPDDSCELWTAHDFRPMPREKYEPHPEAAIPQKPHS